MPIDTPWQTDNPVGEPPPLPPTSRGGPAVAVVACLALIVGVVAWVVTGKAVESSGAGASPAADMLFALPVELPNAAFAGTPKDIPPGAHMPPQTGKDRGPYYLPKEIVGTLTNVAFEKPVTSSDPYPFIGGLEQVTDGDKEPLENRWVELAPGIQWVQVDLGESVDAYAILIWHTHIEARIYRDIVVQVSDEPDFKNPVTLFNNDFDNSANLGKGEDYEYFENYEGLLVPLFDTKTGSGRKFRYVRAYSNGCTSVDANHYAELEVWARKP